MPSRRVKVAVASAVACAALTSSILVAPGVTLADEDLSLNALPGATQGIHDRFDALTVPIVVDGQTVPVSAEMVGARLDVDTPPPLWAIGAWGSSISVTVTVDPRAVQRVLTPSDPVDAQVLLGESGFEVTPGFPGEYFEPASIEAAFLAALGAAEGASSVSAVELAPKLTTDSAQAAADEANGTLSAAGVWLDGERLDSADTRSWVSVTVHDGAFVVDIHPDAEAFDAAVASVERAPVNGIAYVNRAGTVIRTEGATDGVSVADVERARAEFLSTGRADLSAIPSPAQNITRHREIDVNLTTQRLTMLEDGVAVDSWLISSGRTGPSETHTGRFTVNYHVASQTMRGTNFDTGVAYDVDDVKWVMYFNGDQAFHGAYWHSNFGSRMSNGCVNMPEVQAQKLYEWAPAGVDVHIHD